MELEHQSRNTVISLRKQAKRLKDKQRMINEMILNQDKIT